MRILKSIEPWLRTLYINELSILILLVMVYMFILGRVPLDFSAFGPWWLDLVMVLLLGFGPLILVWSVAELLSSEKAGLLATASRDLQE